MKFIAISVDLLDNAEYKILKMVQELSFGNETEILKSNARSNVTKSSNILRLDVFVETSSDRHNHSLEPQKG